MVTEFVVPLKGTKDEAEYLFGYLPDDLTDETYTMKCVPGAQILTPWFETMLEHLIKRNANIVFVGGPDGLNNYVNAFAKKHRASNKPQWFMYREWEFFNGYVH